MIPISVVTSQPETENLVIDVIRSGIIAQGPKVAEFERRFADLVGAEHAVAVNNGTTSLVASLQVLDLRARRRGDHEPVHLRRDAQRDPRGRRHGRFADISYDDFNLTRRPSAAASRTGPRPLMPVHLYGQTADMGAIAAARAPSTVSRIVEDAAQAHGATFDGRGAGSFGIGCFSFYATKNLTTGEGGIITTDDATSPTSSAFCATRACASATSTRSPGHNYRMTDLQAVLALPQFDAYPGQLEKRRANAARLIDLLGDVEGLVLPSELPGRGHVWHQFTVLLPEEQAGERDGSSMPSATSTVSAAGSTTPSPCTTTTATATARTSSSPRRPSPRTWHVVASPSPSTPT